MLEASNEAVKCRPYRGFLDGVEEGELLGCWKRGLAKARIDSGWVFVCLHSLPHVPGRL